MTRFHAAIQRPLGRWLVAWAVLVALPVFGFSASWVGLLGSVHVHRQVVADPPAPVLHDFRRGEARAEDVSSATSARSIAQPASHSHSVFERHHHAAADASVMAIDAAADDAAAGDALALALGALALIAGMVAAPTIAAGERARGWGVATGASIRSRDLGRLERPPRTQLPAAGALRVA